MNPLADILIWGGCSCGALTAGNKAVMAINDVEKHRAGSNGPNIYREERIGINKRDRHRQG
jgi:hypothetical protein